MKSITSTVGAAFLSVLLGSRGDAITVANHTVETNDRFANNPSFIGNAYDFSGVGRSTNTADTRWATLIGDNYFISANHYFPAVGSQIQFIAGNSVSSPTYTYTVAGGFQVPGTDFWIGYTEAVMDLSLARYSYTTTPGNTLAETGLSGIDVFMVGDRVAGSAGSPTAQTVGTNQVETFRNTGTTAMITPQTTVNFADTATFDQLVTFENIPGDDTLNFTTHESQLAAGDSGSPLFRASGTDLILLGTAWAVSTAVPGNFIDTSGLAGGVNDPFEARASTYYTYIGSYETAIASTIAAIPQPIPELSSLLLTLPALLLPFRRRR
jgi:hypothetical protein